MQPQATTQYNIYCTSKSKNKHEHLTNSIPYCNISKEKKEDLNNVLCMKRIKHFPRAA